MALTFDDVTAIIKTSIVPKVQTNWKNKSVLAIKLMKEGRKAPIMRRYTDGVKYPLFYTSQGGAKWFTKDDPLPNPQNPAVTSAQYDYKFGVCPIPCYGTDAAKVTGEDAIKEFIAVRKQNAMDTMWDLVGTAVYSSAADGAKDLIGLRAVTDNDPYGKLTAADVIGPTGTTVWAAKTVTVASFTLALFTKQWARTWDGGTDKSNLGITRPLLWAKFHSLLQPQERYVTDSDDETRKAGFTSLVYQGVPIYADTYCPVSDASANLYLLQTDYLDMFIHPDLNFSVEGPIQMPEMWAKTWRILFSGNIATSRRDRQLVIKGLDPDA